MADTSLTFEVSRKYSTRIVFWDNPSSSEVGDGSVCAIYVGSWISSSYVKDTAVSKECKLRPSISLSC